MNLPEASKSALEVQQARIREVRERNEAAHKAAKEKRKDADERAEIARRADYCH